MAKLFHLLAYCKYCSHVQLLDFQIQYFLPGFVAVSSVLILLYSTS